MTDQVTSVTINDRGYNEAAARMVASNKAIGQSGEQADKGIQKIDDTTRKLVTTVGGSVGAFERLRRELDANYDAHVRLERAQRAADAAVRAERISRAEADTVLARYRTTLGSLGDAQTRAASGAQLQAHQISNLSQQIQDFGVQVFSGQSALTAFAQQAPQAAFAVGGFGNLARLAVHPVTLLVGAVGGLAAGLIAMATHSEAAERAFKGFETSLTATGRGAALTREQLAGLVTETAKLPGMGRDAAQAVVGELAKVREIGPGLFGDLAKVAGDFARVTGQDAAGAARDLAKAFADPAKGAQQLSDQFGLLTSAQLELIKSLSAGGDRLEAQRVLADAVNDRFKGLAREGMTDLERATDSVARSWERLKNAVFGGSGASTRGVAELEGRLTEVDNLLRQPSQSRTSMQRADLERERTDLRQQLDRARTQSTIATYEGIRQNYAGSGMSAQDVIKSGMAAGDSYGPNAKLRTLTGDAGRLSLAYSAAVDAGDTTAAATIQGQLKELTKAYETALDPDRLARERAAAAARQKEVQEFVKELNRGIDSQMEMVKGQGESIKQAQKLQEEQSKQNAALESHVAGIETQVRLLGLSKEQRAEEEAIIRASAAAQRELTDAEKERVVNGDRSLRQARELSQANEKAAQESIRYWDRAADNIGDSLAQALVSGFDRGQSGARLFVDALKRMLLSALGETISAQFFRPAIGSVFGALGLGSGAAQAGTGGGGILDLFGGVASAANPSGLGGILTSVGGGISSLFGGGAAAAEGIALAGSLGAPTGAAAGALSGGAGLLGSLGAAVPYVGAALAAGTLAYSIFGKKKPSVGPNGTAGVFLDGGQAVSRMTSGDNGFTGGNVVGFAELAAKALNDIAAAKGSSLTAATVGGFSELQGRFGFSGDGGGYANSTSAETAVADFVRDRISAGAIAGINQISEEELAAAVSGKLTDTLTDTLRQTLLADINDQIAAQQRLADAYRRVTDQIQASIDSLKIGDISPLTPAERLAEARGQFASVVGRARNGDLDALNAAPQLAQNVLSLSRSYSPAGYSNDFNATLGTLNELRGVSQGRVDSATAAIERLNAMQQEILTAQLARLQSMESELKGMREDFRRVAERLAA